MASSVICSGLDLFKPPTKPLLNLPLNHSLLLFLPLSPKQAYYLAAPFAMERAPTAQLNLFAGKKGGAVKLGSGVTVEQLEEYPVRSLVFEAGDSLQEVGYQWHCHSRPVLAHAVGLEESRGTTCNRHPVLQQVVAQTAA